MDIGEGTECPVRPDNSHFGMPSFSRISSLVHAIPPSRSPIPSSTRCRKPPRLFFDVGSLRHQCSPSGILSQTPPPRRFPAFGALAPVPLPDPRGVEVRVLDRLARRLALGVEREVLFREVV